ncbi:MAG: FAD binding domain-containing protein [Gammaproteobacteria bacterium]
MSVAIKPIPFLLNQSVVEEYAPPGAVMLDIIRRSHHLTGVKGACRGGDCGACLVLLGKADAGGGMHYEPVNSCLLPLGAVAGCHVVTIEGVSGRRLNPIQQALVSEGGIQCGFCTPGIVLALTAFFLNGADSDIAAAIDSVAGNLCRCTGYSGIKRAASRLCSRFDLSCSPAQNRIHDCIHREMLPSYFATITAQLGALPAAKPAPDEDNAILVAGGTDLFVQKPGHLLERPLHFLKPAQSSECVRLEGGQCLIDAAATIEQLRLSPVMQALFPAIADDFKLICSAAVRYRATVGGNVVNASPIGDLSVFFLALDAVLVLEGPGRKRKVRLRDFFNAYRQTDRRPDEQLLEIGFGVPSSPAGFSFEKVSKRTFLDIASVNSALSIRQSNGYIQSAQLSAGGVAPIPFYLAKTSEYLSGKPLRADTVGKAAAVAWSEISPIADIRGSEAYKRLLLRQLIFAHFLKMFPQQINWEDLNAFA